MPLTNLKLLFIFFSLFFILSLCPLNNIFALEVKYPQLANNIDLNAGGDISTPDYTKYLFDLGMFIGFASVFISILLSGAAYFLSAVYPSSGPLAWAKDRFSGALSGLVILVTLYLIIVTINPKLGFLSSNNLPPLPPLPSEKSPGIHFYTNNSCEGQASQIWQSGVNDLGALRGTVSSVGVVQDPINNTYFVGVLYNNTRYNGKCEYLLPNINCQTIEPVAGFSSSVFSYEFEPNGDGVYFYRNSNFNEKGGYYKIANDDISGVYEEYLENLKFTDPALEGSDNPDGCTVPKEEQDCKEYNQQGICTKRTCPSLAGNNISSMYINGDYAVLLVYISKDDPPLDEEGPWSNCQEFPTPDDVNKFGPTQLKWEPISKDRTGLANAIIIIPIKK